VGHYTSAAIPVLETWLTDKALPKRLAAADCLGKIGGNPHVFVPVVTAGLGNGNSEFLDYQLEILARFKNEAKPAVPSLLAILKNTPESKNSTNAAIRNEVISALLEIDPKAAAKAGVR